MLLQKIFLSCHETAILDVIIFKSLFPGKHLTHLLKAKALYPKERVCLVKDLFCTDKSMRVASECSFSCMELILVLANFINDLKYILRRGSVTFHQFSSHTDSFLKDSN